MLVETGLPARSRTIAVPPVTVTVKLVLAASVELGFRIHVLVVPLRDTTPAIGVPVTAFFSVKVDAVTPAIPSLNVAETFAVRLVPVAPLAGVRVVIVGAGPVVKLHPVDASGLPAASRIAKTPPVRLTAYFVSGAYAVVG